MRISIIFLIAFTFVGINTKSQTTDKQPFANEWYISAYAGGSISLFKNQDSDLHRKGENINSMGEAFLSVEAMKLWKGYAFITGIGRKRQDFSVKNTDSFADFITSFFGGTPATPPYTDVSFINQYAIFPIGLGKDLTPRAHQPLILYSVLSNEFLLHSEADILFHPSTPDDQRVIWQNRLDNLHKRKYHQKLLIGLSSKWKSERSGIGLGMDIFIQRVLTDVNDGIVKRPGGLGIRIAIEYAFGGIHALN